MRGWRICKRRWIKSAFNGDGARRTGGRWNHKGVAVVYASTSLALASLELFVHLEPEDMPSDLVSIAAEVPDDISSERIELTDLPGNWRAYPVQIALREIGTEWARSGRTAVLIVPSAVVPAEHNILLNPFHPKFSRVRIGVPQSFHFDPRMWK